MVWTLECFPESGCYSPPSIFPSFSVFTELFHHTPLSRWHLRYIFYTKVARKWRESTREGVPFFQKIQAMKNKDTFIPNKVTAQVHCKSWNIPPKGRLMNKHYMRFNTEQGHQFKQISLSLSHTHTSLFSIAYLSQSELHYDKWGLWQIPMSALSRENCKMCIFQVFLEFKTA